MTKAKLTCFGHRIATAWSANLRLVLRAPKVPFKLSFLLEAIAQRHVENLSANQTRG